MNKQQIILFAATIFASCNSGSINSSEVDTVTSNTPDTSSNQMKVQIPNTTCYSNTKGKDTVYLKIEQFPNVVTGNLQYLLHEKDKNNGTLDGKFYGDTLIADYTFMSEGVQSVRQVAFLVTTDMVTEGYADMEEKDGKMIFKDISTLDFSKGMQLKKADCTLN